MVPKCHFCIISFFQLGVLVPDFVIFYYILFIIIIICIVIIYYLLLFQLLLFIIRLLSLYFIVNYYYCTYYYYTIYIIIIFRLFFPNAFLSHLLVNTAKTTEVPSASVRRMLSATRRIWLPYQTSFFLYYEYKALILRAEKFCGQMRTGFELDRNNIKSVYKNASTYW
jgi:hypothetical protein